MVSAWRIVKAQHAATAFDGEGARRVGGRWNSPGNAAVYVSSSAALAVLEMLVHLGTPSVLPAYVLIECRFERSLVVTLQPANLPARWRDHPAPAEVQGVGDRWLRDGQSAVLEVPSVVVPQESNFVLNPSHKRFHEIQILEPGPYVLDQRLAQR